MNRLVRILSGIGLASLALAGCGGPLNVDAADEANFYNPPHQIPFPHPLPPVTYPDYGVDFFSTLPPCGAPTATDYENWNGVSLWGSHAGIIVPYYTYNTAARVPGDVNVNRWELFGVDTDTDTIVWHMFAVPEVGSDGKIGPPQKLLEMTGALDYYCHPLKWGSGGLASSKPPKDPPLPPDPTGGVGRVFICPGSGIVSDAHARIAGCSSDYGQ